MIGRSVPLIVTLHYQNNKHSPINKKDLFTIENSHLLIIDDESGEVEIKVRIEGVSRAHEHNHFVIKIEPDIVKVPRNNEIGFTFTSPIEVLSKPKLSKKFTTTQQIQQIQQIQEEEKKNLSTQQYNQFTNKNLTKRNISDYDNYQSCETPPSKLQKRDDYLFSPVSPSSIRSSISLLSPCSSSFSLTSSTTSFTTQTENRNNFQTIIDRIEQLNRINESIKTINFFQIRYVITSPLFPSLLNHC